VHIVKQWLLKIVTVRFCEIVHLPPDTRERALPHSHAGTRLTYPVSSMDGRPSWPRWLGTYRDGLPVSREPPIQVVTGPGVEQPGRHSATGWVPISTFFHWIYSLKMCI